MAPVVVARRVFENLPEHVPGPAAGRRRAARAAAHQRSMASTVRLPPLRNHVVVPPDVIAWNRPVRTPGPMGSRATSTGSRVGRAGPAPVRAANAAQQTRLDR